MPLVKLEDFDQTTAKVFGNDLKGMGVYTDR